MSGNLLITFPEAMKCLIFHVSDRYFMLCRYLGISLYYVVYSITGHAIRKGESTVQDITRMSDQSMHLAKWTPALEQVTVRHLVNPCRVKTLSRLNPTSGFGRFYIILSGLPTSFCLVYLRKFNPNGIFA